jgi:hypothetical protein
LLNGYVLNLVSEYRANYWLVTIGVVIEFIVVVIAARRWIRVDYDLFELAGFVVTVVGVWVYFIAPSLPTLLPPTQSSDAVRIYLQILYTYPDGKLVSWYPAGGTFFVATLAHWLQWDPLRVLHPTAALFIAASAGAVYGMTCDLLGGERSNKIWALIAPALLFVPWSYFAGIIDWEQHYFAGVRAILHTGSSLVYDELHKTTERNLGGAGRGCTARHAGGISGLCRACSGCLSWSSWLRVCGVSQKCVARRRHWEFL